MEQDDIDEILAEMQADLEEFIKLLENEEWT